MRRFFTVRDGPHGYLSQVLFCCETRSSAFDAFHTELRPWAANIRFRNWHGHLGDRYGRVSSAIHWKMAEC